MSRPDTSAEAFEGATIILTYCINYSRASELFLKKRKEEN